MGSLDAPGPGGSGILRHAAREQAWEPAGAGDSDTIEATERHIARHFGPIATVWHEVVSDLVHIDVHVVEPSAERPYFTLVTSGMSDRPITVPAGADSNPYAELMTCLPSPQPVKPPAFRAR